MSTQNRWIALRDQQPADNEFPVAAGRWEGDKWYIQGGYMTYSSLNGFTHWYSTKLVFPSPPKREPTLAQMDNAAYSAWSLATKEMPVRYDVWCAGIAYERAEVARMIQFALGTADAGNLVATGMSDRLTVLRKICERVKGNP